jgi:flagellar L-ring protein precursor FlgH
MMIFLRSSILFVAIFGSLTASSTAENLYKSTSKAALASDRRASDIGDTLTVLVFQSAEATNSMQNNSQRKTNVGGSISAGSSFNHSANLQIGGGYNGQGEVRRSEKLVTQITVVVQSVLPNGDLMVAGEQVMRVNGETTRIGVRGRVRPADIAGDNTLLSSRIADAQISYDGKGFVSRSAKPGLINRIFSFLGLG